MIGVKAKIDIWSVVVIGLLWFSAAASLLDDSINAVALYVALPAAAVLCALRWGLRTNVYFKLLMAIYAWSLLTCVFSCDVTVSMATMKQMLGGALVSFIVIKASGHNKNLLWVYAAYIVFYIFMWKYANENLLNIIDVESTRMNDEKLNANHMGYHTFFITFIIYIFGEILDGKLKKVFRLLLFAIIPLSIFTALVTASRQILIIQIPLLALLLYHRYLWGKLSARRIVVVLLVVVVATYLLRDYVVSLFDGSLLAVRSETELTDDNRIYLLWRAFYVGLHNPVFGVGPGCFIYFSGTMHFSHCTYTELMACSGLIPAFLYIAIIYKFVKMQVARYKETKLPLFLAFTVFGIIFALDNFFYVFHTDIWLISFLMIVCAHGELYFMELENKDAEKIEAVK